MHLAAMCTSIRIARSPVSHRRTDACFPLLCLILLNRIKCLFLYSMKIHETQKQLPPTSITIRHRNRTIFVSSFRSPSLFARSIEQWLDWRLLLMEGHRSFASPSEDLLLARAPVLPLPSSMSDLRLPWRSFRRHLYRRTAVDWISEPLDPHQRDDSVLSLWYSMHRDDDIPHREWWWDFYHWHVVFLTLDKRNSMIRSLRMRCSSLLVSTVSFFMESPTAYVVGSTRSWERRFQVWRKSRRCDVVNDPPCLI